MSLTVLLPGLLWPREIFAEVASGLQLPALSQMLGRGRRQATPDPTAEDWLAACLGTPAPLPQAPLRLAGHGVDPGSDVWLCADPVHLRLEQSGLLLTDPRQLSLTLQEAFALRETLAPLFDDFGAWAALEDHHPGEWHLRLRPTMAGNALGTPTLGSAIGTPATSLLSQDRNQLPWHRLLNEVQMLLHAHPVNQRREANGQPVINSLWFWGAGVSPSIGRAPWGWVGGDAPLVPGLAAALGVPQALTTRTEDHGLLMMDALRPLRQAGDAVGWREAIAAIDGLWLAPLLAALDQGTLPAVSLVLPDIEGAVQLEVAAGGRWKFWRKPQPVESLRP